MRVIAGKLGGRVISSPKKTRTHPMSDKIRNSLFNALGDISNLTILDVFAGSGALAIEAISRGAKSAVTIEADRQANDTIKSNIKNLNLGNEIKPINAYFSSWSNNNVDQTFDLVIADPPYNDLQLNKLSKLERHLKSDGKLVISLPSKQEKIGFESLELLQTKKYGDAQLVFYHKVS